MIIRAAHLTLRVCLTFIGILLIVLALLSSGVRLGLPLVANYKSSIESRVSDYLRNPVAIGDLSLSWEGFGPSLKAEQVSVFESVERKVTLDELLIDVNLFKSLLRGVPVINELTLVGASLAIEADQAGQFSLHGMESVRTGRAMQAGISPGNGSGVDVTAWLLNARKVGLLDTEVTFIDQRADRRLVMEDLNIRAENQADMHQLRIDVRLPKELGGTLEAGIDLIGEADSLSASDGDLYLKADAVQVQALLELLQLAGLSLPVEQSVTSLDTSVSLELWGEWVNGTLVSARGPLTTSPVVSAASGHEVLKGINATLAFSQADGLTTIRGSDIVLKDALSPVAIRSIQAQWPTVAVDTAKPPAWSVSAEGEQMDFGAASRLASAVLSSGQPHMANNLQQANVRGDLLDWSVLFNSVEGSPSVTVDAQVNKLQADPVAMLPGFGPVSGRINLVDSIGELSLSAESMAMPWNAMTSQALDLDSLTAVIGLDLTNTQRLLMDADIAVVDEGIELGTRLKATLVPEQSPHLDIQSRYSVQDITALKQWLPRRKLSRGFQRWVDRAIEGGSASNGTLLFFGRLSEFPFDEGEGVFRASVDINDGRLSFLPNWPTSTEINGSLDLNGLMLTGRAASSRLDTFNITQTHVQIDRLTAPILRMQGTGQGVLQDVVDFGKRGPLKGFLEPVLRDVTGSDTVEMDLALTVPLYRQKPANERDADDPEPVRFSVDGALFLSGNTLEFGRADMALANVTGAIGFDHNGIRINNLKATTLGQPVNVSAQTLEKPAGVETRLTMSGAMEGSDVLAHYGIPLDQFIRGASRWQVELTAPHDAQRIATEGVGLRAQSDLVGTEIVLPEPLYKTSGIAQSFELSTAFREDSSQVDWNIKLDGQARAIARVANSELQSLVVGLGADRLPSAVINSMEAGIHVSGRADRLAADDWVDSIARLIDSFPDTGDNPEPILPISASINVDSFELGPRSLGAARIRTNYDDTYLNAVLTNSYLDGSVRYPREYWRKDVALKARIAHVDMAVIDALSEEEDTETSASDSAALDPRLLPPIDARVASFTYGKQDIRDIVIRAQPDISGLQITTLGFAYETMQLVGQGYWRLLDPQGVNASLADRHVTQLDLVLQSDNFGEGLSSIGLNEVLSEGEGSVEMQLSWPGPAYLPSLDTLDGTVSLQLERGNIIPLEPGAGRMVGLFALQALPRRLDLDFKDISADGLAFKRITGNASIEDGVVDVDLVQLTGPIGVVDVVGQTDLNTQAFDQRITVLPRVSAALPIIGVISGGASAGVGALVAAGFLKALGIDLDRLGLRDFSLTGTWDNPEIKSVATDYRRNR